MPICRVIPAVAPSLLKQLFAGSIANGVDYSYLQLAMNSAHNAAQLGVPAVIANGSRPNVLLRVRLLACCHIALQPLKHLKAVACVTVDSAAGGQGSVTKEFEGLKWQQPLSKKHSLRAEAQNTSCWVLQVMEGLQEGTLVDKDAAEAEEREAGARSAPTAVPSPTVGKGAVPDLGPENGNGIVSDVGREMAQAARAASRKLQAAATEVTARDSYYMLAQAFQSASLVKAAVAGKLHCSNTGQFAEPLVGSSLKCIPF